MSNSGKPPGLRTDNCLPRSKRLNDHVWKRIPPQGRNDGDVDGRIKGPCSTSEAKPFNTWILELTFQLSHIGVGAQACYFSAASPPREVCGRLEKHEYALRLAHFPDKSEYEIFGVNPSGRGE